MALIHDLEEYENVIELKKSKRQRRRERKTEKQHMDKYHLILSGITPKTQAQQRTFSCFDKGQNLLLHGYAGTGKTFISLFLALEALEAGRASAITLIRSVVPSRDMGFLPGSEKEKAKVYEAPYVEICDELFHRADAYEILKQKRLINFTTTSFIRGTTMKDSIIIVDECQNLSDHELHTIITRVGEGSRIIFSGDITQSDLVYKKNDVSGLPFFLKIIKEMKSFAVIEFGPEDILRSDLVKEYILTRERMKFI